MFTLIIGLLLACLVQWEPLKESGIYRVLLILPYAVPAFISILIFRGLFNQNFGEINMVLHNLFGIKPEWFTNEYLAKAMILIVNCWLGYPYMMILTMGLLKAIPEDLYEASAIDGANPLHNLRHITVPMIIKPLVPLLIASFAFNFNNFVLINLLTGGGPNLIDASTPAGATDILVSYTFRIAFGSYGQDFGLASAIAGLIFIHCWFHRLGQPESHQQTAGAITWQWCNPRNLKYRVWAARLFLIAFLCLIMFPFLMIISVSFRAGNFATGSLIPTNPSLEHWAMAFGIPWERADGTLMQPTFPVLTWLWKLGEDQCYYIDVYSAAVDHRRLCLCPPALPLQAGVVAVHDDFADVPCGTGTGGVPRDLRQAG